MSDVNRSQGGGARDREAAPPPAPALPAAADDEVDDEEDDASVSMPLPCIDRTARATMRASAALSMLPDRLDAADEDAEDAAEEVEFVMRRGGGRARADEDEACRGGRAAGRAADDEDEADAEAVSAAAALLPAPRVIAMAAGAGAATAPCAPPATPAPMPVPWPADARGVSPMCRRAALAGEGRPG